MIIILYVGFFYKKKLEGVKIAVVKCTIFFKDFYNRLPHLKYIIILHVKL